MSVFILDRTKVKIPTNPTIDFAEDMVKKAKKSGCSRVISTGGGSTIDVGKYVAWKLNLKHTAIPTTAGTGSEVSKYAVFIHNGKKLSFEDDKLIPDNFVLNPEFVTSLPIRETLSSGLDAFCQAIEGYWTKPSDRVVAGFTKQVVALVRDSLDISMRHPYNILPRFNMLLAANYSGRIINFTRTSICHAISYPLTIDYKIPHGIACALTLPMFFDEFADRLDDDIVKKQDITDTFIRAGFNPRLYIKKSKIDWKTVCGKAVLEGRAKNIPRKPYTADELYNIIMKYYEKH